ncbi:hypothetical protein HYW42_04685 [Candidatus Daviesbacteria bacterium]|nr:hypothetical protein [Candidatus Daviesbacteria bacterium]
MVVEYLLAQQVLFYWINMSGEHTAKTEMLRAISWAETGGNDPLRGLGTFQRRFDSLPDRGRAFSLQDQILRCIDEGTVGGVHLAGSGLFYRDKIGSDFRGRVHGVYSHEGCGAAKLFAQTHGIQVENTDGVGDQEAKEIAGILQVPYLGRIPAEGMMRPREIHVARAVYYVGSREFDPAAINLPPGFVINREMISDASYALAEVELATQIAQGEHGFGDSFTGETPLFIVAVSDRKTHSVPLERLAEELTDLSKRLRAVELDTIQFSA